MVSTAMKYKYRTFFAIITSAFTAVVGGFVGPFIIAILLDQIQAGTITLAGSVWYILAYLLTQVWGEIVGWRIVLYLMWTMETYARRDIYRRVFKTLTSQSLSFHADRFGGGLVSQTTKLANSFELFWDTIFFQISATVATILAAVVILSFMLWQYTVFMLILSILFAITAFFGSRFLAVRNKEEAQANTDSNAHVADAVANVMTIKSYGREDEELDLMNKKTKHWMHKSLHTMRGFLGISTVYSSFLAIINVSALVAAIWASEANLASISTVYLAVTYTFTVAGRLWEMNNIMRNYNRVMGDAHDMTEILLLEPSVKDTSTTKLSVTNGLVEITDVDFTHEGNKEVLFNKFNLVITPGQKVGLVGPSGSGKTTLTKLILRFADVNHGTIKIDGQDITDVSQQSLRHMIAYVPQEPLLFHRTLRENISYGRPDATEEEIIEASRQANAYEFIEKLPDGFETMVGERGVKLSGGQRQRVAIARAILKDAPILLLDEATSALDSESEKLIQDALEKLMKGRTSIVIAHRLSTIAKLDRIIVMEEGKIVEDGSHEDLLKNTGTYAKLWSHQSGGFIEE